MTSVINVPKITTQWLRLKHPNDVVYNINFENVTLSVKPITIKDKHTKSPAENENMKTKVTFDKNKDTSRQQALAHIGASVDCGTTVYTIIEWGVIKGLNNSLIQLDLHDTKSLGLSSKQVEIDLSKAVHVYDDKHPFPVSDESNMKIGTISADISYKETTHIRIFQREIELQGDVVFDTDQGVLEKSIGELISDLQWNNLECVSALKVSGKIAEFTLKGEMNFTQRHNPIITWK